MTDQLHISASPHIHSGRSTSRIMLDVVIALMPTSLAGIVIFGWRALLVLASSVIFCVGAEALFDLIVKKKQTVSDLSAVVTGLILGLNLSADIKLWQIAIGALFAIVVVKCIFGGLGCNLVNPAIAARVFMLISFDSLITSSFPAWADTVSSATPLPTIMGGAEVGLLDLFLGNIGGTIGEVCKPALILGLIYLLCRKVITLHTPLAYIGSAMLFTFLLGGFDAANTLALTLSGSLIFGAIFMATDYVTTPTTPLGRIIFGVGAGLVTVLIRFYGVYPEGVSFAILLMNVVTPLIDRYIRIKPFGGCKA